MRNVNLLKILSDYPLFTLNDFAKITRSTQKYARTHLYRLKKQGLIFRIEKGKYTLHDDPMIYASYIAMPSYISFWTAIRYYGLTEQLPLTIMISAARPRKGLESAGRKIRFFKMRHMWGYKKERYSGFDIFIAEKEKCIIDSLLIRNIPFDEIAKAVNPEEIDMKKLEMYALKTGNKSAMKRAGYLMELRGFDAGKLLNNIDNNYIALNWDGVKRGKKNRKWKISVNWRESDFS